MTDFNRIDTLELDKAKLQLKVQALSERISEMTAQYEDKIADLRVELTLLNQRVQTQASSHPPQEQAPAVLEGEVVND